LRRHGDRNMRMKIRSVCSSFGANGIKARKRGRPGKVHACVLRVCPGAAVGPWKSLDALGPRKHLCLLETSVSTRPLHFRAFRPSRLDKRSRPSTSSSTQQLTVSSTSAVSSTFNRLVILPPNYCHSSRLRRYCGLIG
jgi:hypothetical protein